ncbi:MAG: outer membrane protein transport protein [Muribaculaceae bacterium]|nr:outer membrane protein transport protein [Muribaculaceae bacterium]
MKKKVVATLLGALPMMLMAQSQSAMDAFSLSQSDLRGTARFMSMAGAFGALGGDLSTLNQNPGGIGVYRSSEIGFTFDINMQSTESEAMGVKKSSDQTKVYCNNFGYVGTVNLNSDIMPTFSWGATYARTASFDRIYRGHVPSLSTSMSNYVANFTNGWAPGELDNYSTDRYYENPYQDSGAPWLSILSYNSYLINSIGGTSMYSGLFGNGTYGDALFNIREKGYVDEYSLNFGGNIMNTVYWGIGFGITDLDYSIEALYDEQLCDIPSEIPDEYYDGHYELKNETRITGSGFNFKAGLIFKPVNELRLGFAIHTPTYYDLQQETWGMINYDYSVGDFYGTEYTDNGYISYYDSKLKTPWRLIASAAGVIGSKGILSFDYEYDAYSDMSVQDEYGDTYTDIEGDIKNYYQASHTIRLGGEYRVTPQFSIRAGYSYKTSPVKNEAADNEEYIYTVGTNPAYNFENTTQHITAGLGYRYKGFYVDMAYVYKHRESTWYAFSKFDMNEAPKAEITDNNNSLVFSLGYKF